MNTIRTISIGALAFALTFGALSSTYAQAPGGGGVGGGGTGGGGTGGGGATVGGWQMELIPSPSGHTGNGTYTHISSTGTTSSPTVTSAGAMIEDMVASHTASFTGEFKVKFTWVGQGAAPEYCYAVLQTDGQWSKSGSAGSVEVGLPIIEPTTPYSPTDLFHRKKGRKVVKIKTTSGVAEYSISGSGSVTILTSNFTSLSNSGYVSWVASADLNVKALGLGYSSFTRKEDIIPGSIPNVYAYPAGGDDFEHQHAEIGLSPTYTNFIFAPNYLTGGVYHLSVYVRTLGNWLNNGYGQSSSVSEGTRTAYPTYSLIDLDNTYGVSDFESMRHTPKTVTLNINQTDSGHVIPGPFAGKLTMLVWAPERILTKTNFDLSEVTIPALFNGNTYRIVNPGQTVTFSLESSYSRTFSWEVEFSGGAEGSIPAFSVHADTGLTLGQQQTSSISTGEDTEVSPSVATRYHYELTTQTFYCSRTLATYDASGYQGDFFNELRNVQQPIKTLELVPETSW